MFFDEIELTQESWHYKLMKFTWRSKTPDLWSFCPYFWLTIFNIIILVPITLPIQFFIQGFRLLDKIACNNKFWDYIDKMAEDDDLFVNLLDRWEDGNKSEKELNKLIPRFSLWKKRDYTNYSNRIQERLLKKRGIERYSDEWKEIMEKVRQRRIEARKKRDEEELAAELRRFEADEAESKRRREKKAAFKVKHAWYFDRVAAIKESFRNPNVTKIVVRTKKVVTFILGSGVVLAAAWGVWWLFDWLFSFDSGFNWSGRYAWYGIRAPFAVLLSLWSIVFVAERLSAMIGPTIDKWFNKLKLNYEERGGLYRTLRGLGKFFKGIYLVVLYYPIKWILAPFKFFAMYFKAVKNDNCPAIVWKVKESTK